MRILLILPAAENYRVAPGQEPCARPMLRFSVLPLLSVAAHTPAGHDVALLDENVEAFDPDAWGDVGLVGITMMTGTAPRAYELAAHFRARGVPVVAGGYHATLCSEEALRHVDAVVAGDADGAWPQAVAEAAAGGLRQRIYRGRPGASQPVPRRDLLARNARHYATLNAVQAGRGCQHRCRYCSVSAFHRATYHARPATEVAAEILGLRGDFIFVDDNIISDPTYAAELFTALIPLGRRWVAQCSLLIADDPRLLDLARRAGCRGLFIGIESGSAATLDQFGKSFNHARGIRERVADIRRAGIGVIAGIIVGSDGDDPASFRRTLDFLRRVEVDAIQLNILTPLPGTPLFEDMSRQGRVVDRDWAHYDFRHVVFAPARMTAAQLQQGADWVYHRFYRLDAILGRFVRAVFTLGPYAALLSLRLNLTYRADNQREGIVGRDPAEDAPVAALAPAASAA